MRYWSYLNFTDVTNQSVIRKCENSVCCEQQTMKNCLRAVPFEFIEGEDHTKVLHRFASSTPSTNFNINLPILNLTLP